MIEYEGLIDKYCLDGWDMYSTTIPRSEWGKTEQAETYLRKYWLQSDEYETKWKPIQNQIFINQEVGFPEMLFGDEYVLGIIPGGILFSKDEFEGLERCLQQMNEQQFVIVENSFGGSMQDQPFRIKFPSDIGWVEAMSGNFISAILFEMFHKEYFVFGERAHWGRYAATEFEYPLNIFGFRREYANIFNEEVRPTEEERRLIHTYLPTSYRERTELHII